MKDTTDLMIHIKNIPCVYFVLPCFNEEEGLENTAKILGRLFKNYVRDSLIKPTSRIIFVDDGSSDSTWNIISNLHDTDEMIFGGIKLAHNRGHQNALYAGLMYALKSGCDAAISMDSDLQDDVTVIDKFLEKYRCGYEIVFGVRSRRAKDTWFKRNSAEAFYKVFNALGAETVPNHADYRLMGHESLKALSEYSEVNLFLRGIVPMLGFRTGEVFYERGSRKAGESKYPLKKMISFAVEGITSFSTKPLEFVFLLGVSSVVIGILMFIYVLSSWIRGDAILGWGSVMCSIWVIGGLVMVSLGIVGEYIGKIYLETKHRPRYFIEATL